MLDFLVSFLARTTVTRNVTDNTWYEVGWQRRGTTFILNLVSLSTPSNVTSDLVVSGLNLFGTDMNRTVLVYLGATPLIPGTASTFLLWTHEGVTLGLWQFF